MEKRRISVYANKINLTAKAIHNNCVGVDYVIEQLRNGTITAVNAIEALAGVSAALKEIKMIVAEFDPAYRALREANEAAAKAEQQLKIAKQQYFNM